MRRTSYNLVNLFQELLGEEYSEEVMDDLRPNFLVNVVHANLQETNVLLLILRVVL